MTSSSSLHSRTFSSSSTSIRFLGILKQPDSAPNLLELDECDVVWESLSSDSPSPSAADSAGPTSPGSPFSSSSDLSDDDDSTNDYPHHHHHRRPFTPEKYGLSDALSEERGPLFQQRKPQIGRSATTSAWPVPLTKYGSENMLSGSVKLFHQSAPVNVPAWPRKGTGRLSALEEVEDGEGEEEEGEEMLPPHVIVARSHVTTFSVFEGMGRTLKGRDLRRVRNAVFQKTGFLD